MLLKLGGFQSRSSSTVRMRPWCWPGLDGPSLCQLVPGCSQEETDSVTESALPNCPTGLPRLWLTPDLSRTCSEEGCGRVPSRFVADARKHEAPIKQIARLGSPK